MSYTVKDYPSKAAIKRDLAAGIKIRCYQPYLGPNLASWTGPVTLEGPHYPKPHRWYGTGKMVNGLLVAIS